MRRQFLPALAIFALAACQTQPTKVNETTKREFEQVVEKAQTPLLLGDSTVVLDVRSSFDYGLNRVQNSLSFPWYNLAEDTRRGEVLHDKHQAALRLSLLGVTPASPVVVVGNGQKGEGEEGRLAWTLLYLGFQDVQVSDIETFRKSMTQNPSPSAKNVARWAVNPRDELQIERVELLALGRPDSGAILIDVRSVREFSATDKKAVGAIKLVNVDWQKFYTAQGRPDAGCKAKLAALGVFPESKIVLISNCGVRSAAAAYALIALGFPHVQNFTGGWQALQR